MQFDVQAWKEQQRLAIQLLSSRWTHAKADDDGAMTGLQIKHDKKMSKHWHKDLMDHMHYAPNKCHTDARRITIEASIVQELPWLNTQQNYQFIYTTAAPAASVSLNNIPLPKNNVAAVYGIKLLQGYSADGSVLACNRIYRAYGIGASDYALYNSVCKLLTEDTTSIVQMNGQNFIDYGVSLEQRAGMFYGAVPINPIRLVSGELGTFEYDVNLINPITTLTLTPNVYIKCELLCAMGQASGA